MCQISKNVNVDELKKQKAAEEAAAKAAEGDGKKSGIHWIPLAISGAVLVGGAVVAVLFNDKAKKEKEAFDDELAQGDASNYSDHNDNAQKYQRNRMIGIGAAALGGVGVVLSFVF